MADDLRGKWKETGKGLGFAFRDLGKTIIKSGATAVKKADAAIDAKSADAAEAVKAAVKVIDKAAVKGLIHKNNAAHKKSALVNRYNKANA